MISLPKIPKQINISKYYFIILSAIVLWTISHSLPGHCEEHRRESPVVKAVNKAGPAVVNVNTEYEIQRRTSPFSGLDPLFDQFYRDFFDPGFQQNLKRTSLGSGVIIDGKRGYILTNAHVVSQSGKINVVMKDEREFEARVIGADADSDLAVLRIEPPVDLPDIEMGDSDDLMIGETVIAIGNPFGFSNTVTTGVISAVKRSIRTENRVYHDFIQTDASINPGNSGGPLLNINGDLIGVNTAIYAKAQGIGFAIPINKAKKIVSDLIRYGEVVPAWIGITVQDIDSRLAKYLNLPKAEGVLVQAVETSGPARDAGIQNGDIILSIGNQSLYSTLDYEAALQNYASGDALTLTLMQNGRKKTVTLKASVFPQKLAGELSLRLFGIVVDDLTPANRRRYRTNSLEGVVITDIHRQSYLAGIGVRPGDIIRQLDDLTIQNLDEFEKAVIKYRRKPSVVVLLQRGGRLYYITVSL